jgi:hypothetical protein
MMANKEPESPNPPQIIGAPQRQSSMIELYKYHQKNGSLDKFYELYPPMRPRQAERDRDGDRER